MSDKNGFFTVFPSVVKEGEETEITITKISDDDDLFDGKYQLKIVPTEKRELPRNKELKILGNLFNTLDIIVKNNEFKFKYLFKGEQEYRLVVLEDGKKKYDFSIYSLNDDLFETLPYRGDLHMHTTCSDGEGTIAQMTSACRSIGLDFICITDHHKYYPSIEAIEMFKGVDCGLKIFPGEEVHNCDMGYIHIVNFAGDHSVNEILEANYDELCERFKKEAKENEELLEVNAFDFAMRKWICNEIRKGGGKAIFPHPYWTIRDEHHIETDFSVYMLKKGIYDIFEIFGGCTVNENQMQEALWQELRLQGIDMPIVASTDAHSFEKEDTHFGKYSTLVFAENVDSIPDAIMNRMSVGVETFPGETPRIAGNFRLLKYGIFLMENFYPVYESYTNELGTLMLDYAENGKCKEQIEAVNEKVQKFRMKFFNKM